MFFHIEKILKNIEKTFIQCFFTLNICFRYCFIQLAENSVPDKVIAEINKIKFGCGFLTAERKTIKDDDFTTPESIDPYT